MGEAYLGSGHRRNNHATVAPFRSVAPVFSKLIFVFWEELGIDIGTPQSGRKRDTLLTSETNPPGHRPFFMPLIKRPFGRGCPPGFMSVNHRDYSGAFPSSLGPRPSFKKPGYSAYHETMARVLTRHLMDAKSFPSLLTYINLQESPLPSIVLNLLENGENQPTKKGQLHFDKRSIPQQPPSNAYLCSPFLTSPIQRDSRTLHFPPSTTEESSLACFLSLRVFFAGRTSNSLSVSSSMTVATRFLVLVWMKDFSLACFLSFRVFFAGRTSNSRSGPIRASGPLACSRSHRILFFFYLSG